jgi:hypothetical protein
MSHKAFGGAVALAFGLTAGLAAQTGNPPQNPPQNPPSAPTAAQAASASQTVTLEGCLVHEKDLPGRAPNVAEKAGVMEDYILTSAKFLKGMPHASGATGATGAAAEHPTGTSGMAAAKSMFEVRGIDDTQLKSLVGQRVEIEGRVNPADFAERQAEKATGEKAGDLPELQGTVIRKATSTEPCPAK